MEGMSERQYAAHVGLSRGAIQKAKDSGRLVQHADGSIDAAASDALRGATTDPAKQRTAATKPPPPAPKLKPVPDTALSAVGDTLRENGLVPPVTGAGTTFLQARTANEVLKAQERHLAIQKKKGALVDRARAETLVFRLARQERDTWVTWPSRVAALMAAEVTAEVEKQSGKPARPERPVMIEAAILQRVLEAHVRQQLDALADLRVNLG